MRALFVAAAIGCAYGACDAGARIRLVTVADAAAPGLCALARSAAVHGYALDVLGANATLGGYHDILEAKPRLLAAFLDGDATLTDDDVVVFVDGFDVLAQAPPAALLAALREIGCPALLFGGESYCFPSTYGPGGGDAPYCARAAASLGARDRLARARAKAKRSLDASEVSAPRVLDDGRGISLRLRPETLTLKVS